MMDSQRPAAESKPARASFFASLLGFPARVAGWLAASAPGRFLHAYEACRESVRESRLARRLHESRLWRLGEPLRRRIGELFTHSPIAKLINRLGELLRFTETRAYGILFSTFGLYTVLVFVIRYFAQWARGAEQSALITGIVITLLSIPMLFSSRPIYITMQESRLLSAFFYRLVGLRQYPYTDKRPLTINPTVAFLIGSLLGIAGFFVHPLYLLGILLGIACFLLLLFSPELCLYTTLLLCPLFFFFEHPSTLLSVILLTGSVSYLFKVLLGKRTFSFEPLDLTVLLLGLLYSSAALFTRGGAASSVEALLYASLLLGYFLAANLLTTPASVGRAITALTAGGAITAMLGLLQYFTGQAIAGWLDSTAYAYISGRITAAFDNPNVLAAYLIMVLPFITAGILKKGRLHGRLGALLIFAACMGAIILTWSRGAWLGVILSFAIFLFAYNPATVYILIPAAVGSFFGLQHLGSAITQRLSSTLSLAADSSISYRLSTWRGALSMGWEHFFGGVGVGEKAFTAVYPYYALSGIESAPHAHNLVLQYFCEFGIIGPLLLLLFVLILFQCILSHQREETNPTIRLYSMAAGGSLLALLAYGLADHAFYNARIFFLFFAIAGIAAALSRVGRLERQRNTPLRDTEAEAYAIEILLREE